MNGSCLICTLHLKDSKNLRLKEIQYISPMPVRLVHLRTKPYMVKNFQFQSISLYAPAYTGHMLRA
jgi:hypothetical protein